MRSLTDPMPHEHQTVAEMPEEEPNERVDCHDWGRVRRTVAYAPTKPLWIHAAEVNIRWVMVHEAAARERGLLKDSRAAGDENALAVCGPEPLDGWIACGGRVVQSSGACGRRFVRGPDC